MAINRPIDFVWFSLKKTAVSFLSEDTVSQPVEKVPLGRVLSRLVVKRKKSLCKTPCTYDCRHFVPLLSTAKSIFRKEEIRNGKTVQAGV